MSTKFNEATYNRPEGDRPIDAPHILVDLQEKMDQLRHENAWLKNDRNGITIFKNKTIRIVLVALHAEAVMDAETEAKFSGIQVLLGKVYVTTSSEKMEVGAGQLITLDKETLDSVTADVESVILLTLCAA